MVPADLLDPVHKMADSIPLDVYAEWLEALNNSDWDRFTDLLDPEAEFTFTHLLPADVARLKGQSQVVASFAGWQSDFSDLHGEITASIRELEWVAVALWWSGTTLRGQRVQFASCHWVRVVGHQIVEMFDYFDQKTYEEQITDGSSQGGR